MRKSHLCFNGDRCCKYCHVEETISEQLTAKKHEAICRHPLNSEDFFIGTANKYSGFINPREHLADICPMNQPFWKKCFLFWKKITK